MFDKLFECTECDEQGRVDSIDDGHDRYRSCSICDGTKKGWIARNPVRTVLCAVTAVALAALTYRAFV